MNNKFFVRVKGADKEKITAVFGTVAFVEADVENEFAFVTSVMTEHAFKEKAALAGEILSMIRMAE